MPLGDLLDSSSHEAGGTTAIICDDAGTSYRELSQRTTTLASWLQEEEGLRTGDRVAIHWANSIELVSLCVACFKAGLIARCLSTFASNPRRWNTFCAIPKHPSVSLSPALKLSPKRPSPSEVSQRGYTPDRQTAGTASLRFPESATRTRQPSSTHPAPPAHPKGVVHTHGSLSETARVTLLMMDGSGTIGMPTTPVKMERPSTESQISAGYAANR